MTRFVGIVLAVAFSFATLTTESRADGHEVNGIWWNIILNYNNSGEAVCVTEQYNNQTFAAVTFDIYPAPGTVTPIPKPYRHAQVTQKNMQPYTFYKIMGWVPGSAPSDQLQCNLVSWQLVGAKRTRVRPQDVHKSDRLF